MSWIGNRIAAGYDWGDLVAAVNSLIVTPTAWDDDDGPVELVDESLTVDTVNIIGPDPYGPRFWQLDHAATGMWEHAPSGTPPAPLVELLFTIAMVSMDSPRHVQRETATDGPS